MMNTASDKLATALRSEIEEYGSLLALFEEQQRMLFARQPARVLELSAEIEAETARLVEVRKHREQLVTDFALSAGRPAASTLRSVLGLLEREAQPLFEALVREINVLVLRVRQVSRQNRLLLQRAIQSHQDLIRTLEPDRFVQTYGPAGRVGTVLNRPVAILDVAG